MSQNTHPTDIMTSHTSDRSSTDQPSSLTVVDTDDEHFIFVRDGFQCHVCGKVGHPHDLDDDLMLAHPTYPDNEPMNHITVCGDCWGTHTYEQLDEYLDAMQAHQQALEQESGEYGENQGRAFERDEHTCQVCGKEGIPKADRGLIAYPVRAGDYHLDNLVTICDDCLTETLDSDEDEQTAADRLRIKAARAQAWIDTADDPTPDGTDDDHGGTTDEETGGTDG